MSKNYYGENDGFIQRHPVLINIIIILLVAIIGVWIAFLSLQLFTKHGESDVVPGVENMSYTKAIKILHEKGFRVDIRDSVYNEEVHPGYVMEQFPKAKSTVKPGRKVFLYINAVNPRQVVIDADNSGTGAALKGYSMRQGIAKLEELGFKDVKVVKVLGDNDRVIKVTANGKLVKKMEKVPINAKIIMEVYDGQLGEYRDSIQAEEYLRIVREETERRIIDSLRRVHGVSEGGN